MLPARPQPFFGRFYSHPRMARVSMGLYLAASLLPLGCFHLVPSADLPPHVAIASILWRLLHHDPTVGYQFILQPIPYYLAYVVLTPCVGLWGPHLGAAVALGGWFVGLYVAGQNFFAALKLPPSTSLALPLLAYGGLFFWGFIPTFAGAWCVFQCGASLLRYAETVQRRHRVTALIMVLLASLSHVLLLIPVGVLGLAFFAMAPRRHAGTLAMVLGTGASTVVAAFVGLLHPGPAHRLALHFLNPQELVQYLIHHFSTFDRGVGRLGHALFLVLAALWAVRGRRRGTDPQPQARARQRFLNAALLGSALMYLALPVEADAVGANAWGINFRYLIFTEMAFVAWCANRWPPWRSVGLTLGCACSLFGLGLGQFWQTFDAQAMPVVSWFESLPPGQRIWVQAELRHYADAWAPVDSHLDAYYMAAGGRFQSSVFDWGHVPIRPTTDACGPPTDAAAAHCDFVLQDKPTPIDPRLRLLHQAGAWRLFAYSKSDP
jgi:hypothetical protein